MKAAFIYKNSRSGKYSGGRLYTLTLAKAFAEIGFDVDIYTNNIPIYYEEVITGSLKSKVNICCTNYLNTKIINGYEHIILSPHRCSWKNLIIDKITFYKFFTRLLKSNRDAKKWFIDFETPEWMNLLMVEKDNNFLFRNSDKYIKYIDVILSISHTGMKYAKSYYEQINDNLEYKYLYPPINDKIADLVKLKEKKNSAVFFARFDEPHKFASSIFTIIKALPQDYTFEVITNLSRVDSNLISQIEGVSNENGIEVVFNESISELEKFQILARSKVLLFTSKFEGYGLPPVEARYMNTPVISSPLEVIKEVNPQIVFDNFESSKELKVKILNLVNSSKNKDLRTTVSSFAKSSEFCKSLEKII